MELDLVDHAGHPSHGFFAVGHPDGPGLLAQGRRQPMRMYVPCLVLGFVRTVRILQLTAVPLGYEMELLEAKKGFCTKVLFKVVVDGGFVG
eukprot:704208-Prorocentrum_minimum.AAC.2